MGDKVVEQGIVIPIIGINDSAYKVIARIADEESIVSDHLIIKKNSFFPLRVTGRVIIADLATLLEWYPDEGWQDVHVPPGFYSAVVNGFRRVDNDEVVDFGFEIVFTQTNELPQFTGSLTKDMQVLTLPE